MKKVIQAIIAFACVAMLGMSWVNAASIPQPFSTLPYVYDSAFPAAQMNTDFAYALGYTDTTAASAASAATSGQMTGNAATASAVIPTWSVTATSGVVASGTYTAVNTAAAAVTITLPASAAASSATMLDAKNTFGTNNLTINAPSGVNLNSASGTPAAAVFATSGVMVSCSYLNADIGYRCIGM